MEAGVADNIKIYSIDISTSDIQEMREEGSPWKAYGRLLDAFAIGEVSLRALALLVAGEDPGHVIEAKPVLITQDYLNKNDIKTLAELKARCWGTRAKHRRAPRRPRPGCLNRSNSRPGVALTGRPKGRRIP